MAYMADPALCLFLQIALLEHIVYITSVAALCAKTTKLSERNCLPARPKIFTKWPVLKIFADLSIEANPMKYYHFHSLVCLL